MGRKKKELILLEDDLTDIPHWIRDNANIALKASKNHKETSPEISRLFKKLSDELNSLSDTYQRKMRAEYYKMMEKNKKQ